MLVTKKNPKDFALWKKEKQNSITFPSKFGNGTPGWHIECSVISNLMFGNLINVHSGGIDLKFPHHHNEVLQSNVYTNESDNEHQVFKHFIYTGHIHMNGEKMAQSVGNYVTINSYLNDHSTNSMRLLFWMSPWDKPMEITQDMIAQTKVVEKRIIEFISTIEFQIKTNDKNVKFKDLNTTTNEFALLDILNNIDLQLENEFRTDEAIRLLNVFDGNKQNNIIDYR